VVFHIFSENAGGRKNDQEHQKESWAQGVKKQKRKQRRHMRSEENFAKGCSRSFGRPKSKKGDWVGWGHGALMGKNIQITKTYGTAKNTSMGGAKTAGTGQ